MLFSPGQIVVTPAAIAYIVKHNASPHDLIGRHLGGDWGDICVEDRNQCFEIAIFMAGSVLGSHSAEAAITIPLPVQRTLSPRCSVGKSNYLISTVLPPELSNTMFG